MALPVVYHPEYEAEWRDLPPVERAALASAVEKLRADSQLGSRTQALSEAGSGGSGNFVRAGDARGGVRCTGVSGT
jgi:hypothetical protein